MHGIPAEAIDRVGDNNIDRVASNGLAESLEFLAFPQVRARVDFSIDELVI
jgi:hypothetical protein